MLATHYHLFFPCPILYMSLLTLLMVCIPSILNLCLCAYSHIAHDFLVNKVQLLHADISMNNLLINRVPMHRVASADTYGRPLIRTENHEELGWYSFGLLIDLDYLHDLSNTSFPDLGFLSGTPPYIAMERVDTKFQVPQAIRHDLATLLTVIRVICSFTVGPCKLNSNWTSSP